MALEHAILVALSEQASTGYDLARRFDKSIGQFWTATHQQVYKVLGRMEGDGWVDVTVVAQDGRPDKKLYELTTDGRSPSAQLLEFAHGRGQCEAEGERGREAASPGQNDISGADT